MAIDSLRKRASIASLGLAFLGPSVIPDGSLIAADRQVVGNSYYGIAASSAAVKTIGDTSQLEVFTASGGLDVGRNLGATSQLEVFTSSGGITVVVPETIGATSQLEPFTSSGVINSGTGAAVQTGGAVFDFQAARDDEERRLRKLRDEKDLLVILKAVADHGIL